MALMRYALSSFIFALFSLHYFRVYRNYSWLDDWWKYLLGIGGYLAATVVAYSRFATFVCIPLSDNSNYILYLSVTSVESTILK